MKNCIHSLINKLKFEGDLLNEESFKQGAVIVPFVNIDGKIKLVFEKRSLNIPQPGEICFPGGGFDDVLDKNFKDTAVRECSEELGIKREKIEVIKEIPKLANPTSHLIHIFLGKLKISSLDELRPSQGEVEKLIVVDLEWFDKNPARKYTVVSQVRHKLEEADRTALPVEKFGLNKAYQKPWGEKKHQIYVYEYEGEIIWGLTAHITYKILRQIKNG